MLTRASISAGEVPAWNTAAMARRDDRDLLHVAAAGVASGLLAAWIMERWQAGATPLLRTYQEKAGVTASGGDATAKLADDLAELIQGEPVPDDSKGGAGRTIHYAFGAVLGCAYALAAERWSGITAGFGSGFGLLVDIAFDEMLVPALNLSEPDAAYPVSSHVYGVASHLIFGVALEGARLLLVDGAPRRRA